MLGLSTVPARWAAGAAAVRDGPVDADGRVPYFPYPKPAAGFGSEHQTLPFGWLSSAVRCLHVFSHLVCLFFFNP